MGNINVTTEMPEEMARELNRRRKIPYKKLLREYNIAHAQNKPFNMVKELDDASAAQGVFLDEPVCKIRAYNIILQDLDPVEDGNLYDEMLDQIRNLRKEIKLHNQHLNLDIG